MAATDLCKKCNKNRPKRNSEFCSITCRNSFRVGKKSDTWKGGKPNCVDCGKKLSRYNAKRCRSCSAIGERSNNWKGGITKLCFSIRNCKKYKEWRLAVYKNGHYTCSMCGAKNGRGSTVLLNADHFPKKFSVIIKENKIKTLKEALNCDELWNESNGRVLCFECHCLIDGFSNKFKRNGKN